MRQKRENRLTVLNHLHDASFCFDDDDDEDSDEEEDGVFFLKTSHHIQCNKICVFTVLSLCVPDF